MTAHFPDIRCEIGNICTGPYKAGSRQLSAVVFVEFIDQDLRNTIFSSISSGNMTFAYQSSNIKIKRALPKRIRSRIWIVRKVEEMLRSDPRAHGKQVTSNVSNDGGRVIKVGDVVAFTQAKNSDGAFSVEFKDMEMPVPK